MMNNDGFIRFIITMSKRIELARKQSLKCKKCGRARGYYTVAGFKGIYMICENIKCVDYRKVFYGKDDAPKSNEDE